MTTDTRPYPAVDLEAERERAIDVVTSLHSHYRLAELQSAQSLSEAENMGAGETHLRVLRQIAWNDAMLSQQYRAELEQVKARVGMLNRSVYA